MLREPLAPFPPPARLSGHRVFEPPGQQRHAQPHHQEDPRGEDEGEEEHLRALGRGHQPRGTNGRQRPALLHAPQGERGSPEASRLFASAAPRAGVWTPARVPVVLSPEGFDDLRWRVAPGQVRVMYTPLIGDEKRDIVEYTSFGFMNCAHTMLTYTRAMDSALCVPLMIDAAVWCDYFARGGTPQDRVARALAYLFKVPEGGAQGVDPGFFKQMQALEDELEATHRDNEQRHASGGATRAPQAGEDPGGVGAMLTGRVVCAGISCLDVQLCGAGEGEGSLETIREFAETKYCPGGSCPQTSTALAELGVPGVLAVTKMGFDAHGDEMIRQASRV